MASRGPERRKAAQAFRTLEMDRARYERFDIGPGDAYRGLWGLVLDAEEELYGVRQGLKHPATKPAKRKDFEARKEVLIGRIGGYLKALLPYERARLTQNTVRGHREHPLVLVSPVDMKKLSDDDLDAIETVLLKIGGAATGDRGGDGATASGRNTRRLVRDLSEMGKSCERPTRL
jgi:hypothetical protein